ncbi:MAG: hypothetical protein HYR91_07275 [Flavobacteriia bacterium]|nr:hypothetical protein [Flavobacteriia bacterium]
MKAKFTYKFYVFIILTLIGILPSCKKKKNESYKTYTEYFGLSKGRYIVYDVQEMKHDIDAFFLHDTISYQLKTWIGNEYIDNEGRVAREFIRYKRSNASQEWVQSDLWTTIIENNKAEIVEENQRIIKLIFAPILNKTWNANAFNLEDELISTYIGVHQSYSINSLNFDSTVTVEQENYYTMVDCKRKFEVYAKGIGLINKYYKDLRINNFDTTNVEKGTEIYYKCVEYGFQ